ncbi:MAG: SUMF1/EgtB/PvdO family nonheme iron enzyme [Gammaproteobacteria bacterium]|nr:SUMF1/EgtB/PvdO family nonheme iron enzyme [Gammaproteobacteria bacterium]
MAKPKSDSGKLRWTLIGALVVFVAMADWYADGLGPRVILGTATLNLTSEPDAARVFLDGEFVGRTPLVDQTVRPRATVVRMEHRFHDAVARSVSPGRSEVVDLHIEFPPALGSLEIVTNPRGATVLVDGEEIDQVSPILLSPHPTGAVEVTASIHGRETKTELVEVLPRQATELSIELERVAMSEIYVARTPSDLELKIGDQRYEPGMTLPIGAYKLSAERSGYAPVEKTVEFTRGRNDHSVRLVRLQGALSLSVSPPNAAVEVSYPEGAGWRKLPYKEGMRIPTGPVTVRATALGHRSYEQRMTMAAKPLSHAIRLEPYDVRPGRRFRDSLASGGEGPLLVVIGAGTFRMGSTGGSADETPVRTVDVAQPFAIGVFETTRGDYDRFRVAQGLPEATSSSADGDDSLPPESLARLPVTRLSWRNSKDYVAWLSKETGHRYRLPSEAEWEYVARAGSTGRYYFGADPTMLCAHANIADSTYAITYPKPGVAACSDGALRVAVVGGRSVNPFGVHDILGNVEEWVADCWRDNYKGAPPDQSARNGDCPAHVLRGGAWDSLPHESTVSVRSTSTRGSSTRGVRVVREL